jgi:hypothetical protein
VGFANGYRYVGLAVLAGDAGPEPDVINVTSVQVLARWLAGRSPDALGEPVTFVVGIDGRLRLAPRRSEMSTARSGSRYWQSARCSSRGTGGMGGA